MSNIVTFPDERLNQIAEPVAMGERVREIIDAMWEALRQNPNGIGLAAPQIGINKRIIVARVPIKHFSATAIVKHVIINPQILDYRGERELGWEGCLSFPDKQVKIPRWPRITVVGYDARWEAQKIGAKGLVARVLQHEMDHLDGRNLAYYARLAHEAEQEAIAKKKLEEQQIELPFENSGPG